MKYYITLAFCINALLLFADVPVEAEPIVPIGITGMLAVAVFALSYFLYRRYKKNN